MTIQDQHGNNNYLHTYKTYRARHAPASAVRLKSASASIMTASSLALKNNSAAADDDDDDDEC
jgi:hypothetical protein